RELPKWKLNPSLLFRFHAANSPLRTGLIAVCSGGERAYSFLEMDQTMDRLAHALARRGIRARDRVLLMLKNRAELVMVPPALGRMGVAAVPVSWRSTAEEMGFLAANSGARALFFDADVEGVVRQVLERGGPIPREQFFSVGGAVRGFSSYED